MPAYLVGQIKVKDHQLWQKYVAGVAESLSSYDAKILFRGKRFTVLAGENRRDLVVVIEFADHVTLEKWFHSKSYQSLVPLRDAAADVVITGYDPY